MSLIEVPKTSGATPVKTLGFLFVFVFFPPTHADRTDEAQETVNTGKEKNTKTKCCLERTHTRKHQRAFVIQQQPVVIDWSICLCVAYKWATWYSALFIWNQLRQRCCKCVLYEGFVSLPLAHSLFMPARWRPKENKVVKGKRGGRWQKKKKRVYVGARAGEMPVFNSLFNCIRRALAQHVHTYNESSCRCKVLSGILIERRVPVRLQHC